MNLQVDPGNVTEAAFIEEIVPADFVKVRRGFRSQPRTDASSMRPSTGLWFPVTAVLNLDRPGAPVLELSDPTKQRSLTFAGKDFPLSANYTAAFARDFQDSQFDFERLVGLLRFDKFADRIGLYRVTAFDPAKQPCLFIHGINSSPSTWDETINRLYGDEEIRKRYEFAYSSAHLEGVASEVVIRRSAHGVHRTDGGIEEIRRILKLP